MWGQRAGETMQLARITVFRELVMKGTYSGWSCDAYQMLWVSFCSKEATKEQNKVSTNKRIWNDVQHLRCSHITVPAFV